MTSDPQPAIIWTKGDQVLLRYDGERPVEATVILASPNGVSLMVAFEAMIGGHLGMMPLLYQAEGFVSLITSKPVTLAALGDASSV